MRIWWKDRGILKEKEWFIKAKKPDKHKDQKHLNFFVYSLKRIESLSKEETIED